MESFREKVKGQWTQYLSQFTLEWWVSLTFKEPVRSEYAKKRLKSWTRNLIDQERIQIAYLCVINEVKRIHLHLLALGRNRYGKTLTDVSMSKWMKFWKAEADIQATYDVRGVSDYFAQNYIVENDNLTDLVFFNTRLLEKVHNTKCAVKMINSKHNQLDLTEIISHPNYDESSVELQMVDMINSSLKREENHVQYQ